MNDEPTQQNDPAGEPAQPEQIQPEQAQPEQPVQPDPAQQQPYHYPPPPQGGYYYPPPEQPPGTYRPVYYPQGAAAPSNNAAMASIIVACSSIGVLVLTGGLLAPFTLIASGVATFFGHKGKTDVDQGKTPVQRDLAVGGFWTGIGGIVLSVLAIIAWVVIVALLIAAEESGTLTEDNFHDFNFD